MMRIFVFVALAFFSELCPKVGDGLGQAAI